MKVFLNLSIAGLLAIAAGCSKTDKKANDASEAKVKAQSVLHVGNGTEPQDLDPHIVTGVPEQRVVFALFEGLVRENPKNLEPEPGAAESWEVSKDALTYTFNLRKNGKWSNGDALTANDFVYAFKRVLSPELASQNAYMLYAMKNAEAYNKGAEKDFSKVGVKALGDYQLQITLGRPTPYFLSLLTHQAWFPVDRNVIEKFGTSTQRGTKWTLPGNIVGNGAFALKSWEVNKVIKVVKNPLYWDAGNVKLDEADIYPISDSQTEERAFKTGQLHVTYTVPTNKIEVYQRDNPGLIKVTPYLGTFYMVFNVEKPPFDKPEVREALMYAIDKGSIAYNVVKGGKLPSDSFTPPNTAKYTSPTKLPYDVKKARELMAAAGYSDGKGFPAMEIMFNSSDRNRRIAEAIQEMWKKNLNIEVKLINKEWKVYLDTFRSRGFDVALASWIGDYNDPSTFLNMWVTGGGNNRAHWSNRQYDELIDKASGTMVQSERIKYFSEAETILMKQAPIIPLHYNTSLALVKPEVVGWYQNILDHHPLRDVEIKKSENK